MFLLVDEKRVEGNSQRLEWRKDRGAKAIVVCLLCVEAALAGADRSCMPAFDLGILSGQMLMFHLFGIPESESLLAGTPAFVVAALPATSNLGPRWLPHVLAIFSVAAFCIAPVVVFASVVLTLLGFVTAGAVVGFLIRGSRTLERFWLPLGVALALSIGGTIFASGHYGMDNCWP